MKQWCDNFQVASIIFLDAPVGTGFSYATTSQGYNITDHISAAQTYEFLRKVSENSIKIMRLLPFSDELKARDHNK